ncbi:MAG: phosphoribosylanthranilate isomerase [Clostridia bacterium]|nr:phosphoribosylanthranilate isomerase [Clostridia bacterium]
MIVQIAGVKNIEEALFCEKAGVDYIGLLVGQSHASKDFISSEIARDITQSLKKSKSIMITHLTNAKEIIENAKIISCNAIQLHSNIDENEVEKIAKALPKIELLRLIHISQGGEVVNDYKSFKFVTYYFLDTFNPVTNQAGGTGLIPSWEICRDLISKLPKPTFLAGGLNPNNVTEAIKFCKPYGVDCNTGTKNLTTGFRDKEKVIAFTKNAKSNHI